MNLGDIAPLVNQFGNNWASKNPGWALVIAGEDWTNSSGHLLEHAVEDLCGGRATSLPYFKGIDPPLWCTLAPNAEELRQAIRDLHAWVLPSLGWEERGGGIVLPQANVSALAQQILKHSPDGYFRWRCRAGDFMRVMERLGQRRAVIASRPRRTRRLRPSLYEMRSRFSTALLLGDRDLADKAVSDIDLYQLDSATNTQFMRIRLWHHFREFDRIVKHPELSRLLSQPMPPAVTEWIQEALGSAAPSEAAVETSPALVEAAPLPAALGWAAWFQNLKGGKLDAAEQALKEREWISPDTLKVEDAQRLVGIFEEIYLDEDLRKRRRDIICQGLVECLQEFVREPNFPRPALGDLYLATLRLWATLHAGTSAAREEGHVTLELASACLRLNRAPSEVLSLIEEWWNARKVPSQLPFLLDAIELLEREHQEREAPANLWLDAADLVRRGAAQLPPTEKTLWRRVGDRLGFDAACIANYLPPEAEVESCDILEGRGLGKVAIVCMREKQARDAAEIIAGRTKAQIVTVSSASAGVETANALNADVVLIVWMATTHAVFRAFDGFDRKRFVYVQGTGAASIVRSLERWAAAL